LQIIGQSQKKLGHSENSSPPPASQTGYGPALTHFFVAQTVTISVATAGNCSLDLRLSCFYLGLWGFIENMFFTLVKF